MQSGKKTRFLLSLSLTIIVLPLTVFLSQQTQERIGHAATGTSSFVTTVGTQFYLRGQQFRFVGVNMYDAASNPDTHNYDCGPVYSDADLDSSFQFFQQHNISVVRFWAFQSYIKGAGYSAGWDNYQKNGPDWSGIDRVVQTAKKYGIKLLPTLENQWGDCTAANYYKSASWYANDYKNPYGGYPLSYIDWVKLIVTQYKDEPTIMAWMLMNEAESSDTDSLYNFASAMSKLIKSIDPNHLVTLGTLADQGQPGTAGRDYQRLYSIPTIDFADAHDYNNVQSPLPRSSWDTGSPLPDPNTCMNSIACDFSVTTQLLHKPFLIGEAGIQAGTDQASEQNRANEFDAKIQAQWNNGGAGYIIWHWDPHTGNGYDFSPGDPLVSVLQSYGTPVALPTGQVAMNTTGYVRGVNLFGGWQGLYGGQDTFATPKMLDYFKSKGLNTFRVGFVWAHLQPTLNGPLDPTYLAKMDTLVANAKARGQQVAFVPIPGNYNGNQVGSSAVPQSAFNDLWIKLATHYKNETAIWGYDLLSEPNMGDVWNTTIGPSAIAAIRTVDMTHAITVPTSTGGYGHYWAYHTVGLPMQDPANNLIYEAHFYFDTLPNGQYPNGWDVPNNDMNIGVEHATDFVNWCNTNHQKCYAGEYGIPGGWTSGNQTCNYSGGSNDDPRWLTVLDNFLTYLDANHISGTYWAGGPYGDVNSIGPFCDSAGNYIDAPQMAILEKHLGGTTLPTSSSSQTPTSTPPAGNGVTTIDDSSIGTGVNHWNYTGGGWIHCTNCNETNPPVTYFDASQSWDSVVNDSASVTFNGTQLKLYAVTGSWHGIAGVAIDGGTEAMVDLYSPIKTGDVLVWTSPQLSSGVHTLRVRVTGAKNAKSTGIVIPLDRVDIINAT